MSSMAYIEKNLFSHSPEAGGQRSGCQCGWFLVRLPSESLLSELT